MNNPFKVGDEVYTTSFGKGKVFRIDQSERCIGVAHDQGCYWYRPDEVSFSPWPEPNHTRPLKDGWWICSSGVGDQPILRQFEGGHVFYPAGSGTSSPPSAYKRVRYLGKDWKEA